TSGPDGNVWFTEHTTPMDPKQYSIVGRITPQGTITEFSKGLPKMFGPRGIAVGSDGNLWLAGYNTAGEYARMTLNGKFKVYTFIGNLLKIAPYLYDIQPGMKKTLWLTELPSNRVAKLLIL